MSLLLTFSQQQAIKKISTNNQSKYDQLAAEVETSELRDLVGSDLLYDLQHYTPSETPTNEPYYKLLNGTTYTNSIGNAIEHRGLRFVLAYFNFSRYITESFVSDTYSGFVKKNNEFSERLSDSEQKRLIESNRKVAFAEWELIKEFMILNIIDYPKFSQGIQRPVYRPNYEQVRSTNYGRKNTLEYFDPETRTFKRF